MYFSTNVMFCTLHSNSTIYLSTRLLSGDVRVHIEMLWALALGAARVTGGWSIVYMYTVCTVQSSCKCAHVHTVCFVKVCQASQWCDATDECDIW